MWLKCQLCRNIALNLVLSEKKRKSELELDRKVPNSTFWTRGLAANPDNLSNPALIIPSREHSIVIDPPVQLLIELISEMWLRFPRFLPAVPSSDIFVVYPLRARNPPWQLDSRTGGKICQREITASWNLQMCCCGNPKRSVGQIRACKGLLGGIIMLNLYRSCNGARESLFSRQVCNRWTPQTYLRRKEGGEHLFAG